MESYLKHAPCIYFSCGDDGKIIDVNETICEKLGYTRDELVGSKAETIFTIATRIFQQTHFFPLLKMHGSAEEIFLTLLAKDKQQLPVLISASRSIVEGEAVTVYFGIVVHNRKKFEDELIAAKKSAEAALNENKELIEARRQLQHHLEQLDQQVHLVAKQNEELRQFNRVATHDLQEPIRKLFLFVNMLDSNASEQDKAIAAKIRRVSEQMRSVVSGLQQYIWLAESTDTFTNIDLNELINAAVDRLRTEFPDVGLEVKTEDIPSMQADGEQMQMLFYHLLSNVIRFRKPGSPAQAYIAGTSLMKNQFRNVRDKYKYSEAVKLVVSDKGIGFTSDYKEQVFELFKRFHAESGPGVGLALCKRIVENHGGTIDIQSRKDDGAAVTIILPVQQVEDAPAKKMTAKD
jgi:sigma-B regulation protein RsbU (phosphoserine phosphatase)